MKIEKKIYKGRILPLYKQNKNKNLEGNNQRMCYKHRMRLEFNGLRRQWHLPQALKCCLNVATATCGSSACKGVAFFCLLCSLSWGSRGVHAHLSPESIKHGKTHMRGLLLDKCGIDRAFLIYLQTILES